VYVTLVILVQFLLEVAEDLYPVAAAYFSWLYLRLFMRNRLSAQQVGDSSPEFALHAFLPEGKLRERVEKAADWTFGLANRFGLIDFVQERLRAPIHNPNPVERKK
jgi:hypothetical protein